MWKPSADSSLIRLWKGVEKVVLCTSDNSASQQQKQGWSEPWSTSQGKGQAITTRGGNTTHDPPFPKRTGRTPVTLQVEEEKEDNEVLPQDQELQQDSMTPLSYYFHIEMENPKWMNNLVSL